MQKQKQVKAHTRKTKSGKSVMVKAHTVKYDAAKEIRKVMSKEAGTGEEFTKRKGKTFDEKEP